MYTECKERGSKKNFNCAIAIFKVGKFADRFCSSCLSKICTIKDEHEEEGEQLWTDFFKLQTSDRRKTMILLLHHRPNVIRG
jgi:hypothetical protein